MTNSIIPITALVDTDGEPRILDTVLGERLGLARPRDIRVKIRANIVELARYGEVREETTQTSFAGGRPGSRFLLTEGQALLICMWANTPKAADVRKLVIDVFMAWRRGKTVDVKEHYRRPPAPSVDDGHFHMKQSAPGKLIRVDALVPFDLAAEYAMMFSNYRRVTF